MSCAKLITARQKAERKLSKHLTDGLLLVGAMCLSCGGDHMDQNAHGTGAGQKGRGGVTPLLPMVTRDNRVG